MTVWYRVRDLDAARAFYRDRLGLAEVEVNADEGWITLLRGQTQIGLAQGEPEPQGPVALIDVEDIRAETERLRGLGVEVGVVLELHEEIRIADVFDPDGNRVQLAEELAE
jgi:catechol 2,3-dioxygenase-like lactoylglutathione lyase family enzyme